MPVNLKVWKIMTKLGYEREGRASGSQTPEVFGPMLLCDTDYNINMMIEDWIRENIVITWVQQWNLPEKKILSQIQQRVN